MKEKIGIIREISPIILAAIIGFTLAISIFTYLSLQVSRDRIFPNITIQGVDVEYLNEEEVKKKLERHIQSTYHDKSMYLFLNEKSWEFPYDYFIEEYDIDSTIKEANSLGKEGNIFKKIHSYFHFKKQGQDVSLILQLNNTNIKEILEMLREEICVQAEDATIHLENDEIKIISETIGTDLDKDETRSSIEKTLQSPDNEKIQVSVIETIPKITETTLKNVKDQLSGFATKFNPGAQGRAENLRIASSMINGVVLLPGETFSTYETIGPITKSNGYKDAPVIVDGQLEPGVGGGVCQISTTLYNAVVRANLEIVERMHHSIPVSYVPLGQDAAIAGDWIDFKFKNNLEEPLYIQMYTSGSDVIANIYGKKEGDIEKIDLETEVIEEIPPSVSYRKDSNQYTDYRKIQKESKRGYKVNVHKVIYKKNGDIQRELLHKDYYRPVDGIIIQGTREREELYTQTIPDKEGPDTQEVDLDDKEQGDKEQEKPEETIE